MAGDLAASSEMCFGTLAQRTMADPLWSRYHYGHPDMLDKMAMIAQVSNTCVSYHTQEYLISRMGMFDQMAIHHAHAYLTTLSVSLHEGACSTRWP